MILWTIIVISVVNSMVVKLPNICKQDPNYNVLC